MRNHKLARPATALAMIAALSLGGVGSAFASPSPPTNGGNGAGHSGQCTGPQADRPASCQSQGGPGQ
jgi:hypothetical protein